MATFIFKRLIQGVVVLLAVSFMCFVIFRYAGDPVLTLAGLYATHAQREEVRQAMGLDKPFYVQYARFIANAARGEFGKSYVSKAPAFSMILERLPATVELVTLGTLIAFVLGVTLGVLVSLRPRSPTSQLVMALSLGGISIPTFSYRYFAHHDFRGLAQYIAALWQGRHPYPGLLAHRAFDFQRLEAFDSALFYPGHVSTGHASSPYPGPGCGRFWRRNTSKPPGPRGFPPTRSFSSTPFEM